MRQIPAHHIQLASRASASRHGPSVGSPSNKVRRPPHEASQPAQKASRGGQDRRGTRPSAPSGRRFLQRAWPVSADVPQKGGIPRRSSASRANGTYRPALKSATKRGSPPARFGS